MMGDEAVTIEMGGDPCVLDIVESGGVVVADSAFFDRAAAAAADLEFQLGVGGCLILPRSNLETSMTSLNMMAK